MNSHFLVVGFHRHDLKLVLEGSCCSFTWSSDFNPTMQYNPTLLVDKLHKDVPTVLKVQIMDHLCQKIKVLFPWGLLTTLWSNMLLNECSLLIILSNMVTCLMKNLVNHVVSQLMTRFKLRSFGRLSHTVFCYWHMESSFFFTLMLC